MTTAGAPEHRPVAEGRRPTPAGSWITGARFERSCAAACLALAVFVGWRADSLVSHSAVAQPGAFPPHGVLWLGSAVLGLASARWLVQTFGPRQAVPAPDIGPPREVAPTLGILVVGAWAAYWIGLLPAAALTYVALMLYYRDRSRRFIAISVTAYVLLLHYGLEVLLQIPLARSPVLPLPF